MLTNQNKKPYKNEDYLRRWYGAGDEVILSRSIYAPTLGVRPAAKDKLSCNQL